jgi:hypothetical protein
VPPAAAARSAQQLSLRSRQQQLVVLTRRHQRDVALSCRSAAATKSVAEKSVLAPPYNVLITGSTKGVCMC